MSTVRVEEPQPDWVPQDTFASRLGRVRLELRWNTQTAATECKINPENWRQWERGRHPQKIHEIARKISERTGCSYVWLVAGDGKLSSEVGRLTVLPGGRSDKPQQLALSFYPTLRVVDSDAQ